MRRQAAPATSAASSASPDPGLTGALSDAAPARGLTVSLPFGINTVMNLARSRLTPRQEVARLTETRIMEALGELLRRGAETITFDLVSRESGVPQRTVYRYFENKDALFGAFWLWVNESIEMPSAPTTPAEVIDHIPALFAAFDRDEPLVRAMLHTPYGRAVRVAHADARQEKFRLALEGIVEALPPETGRNLLASVTVLCSAAGWETIKDNWRLSGSAAAEAAQWAVRTLILASRRTEKAAAKVTRSSRTEPTKGSPS
jgi:AcrR family transcriptional regulator